MHTAQQTQGPDPQPQRSARAVLLKKIELAGELKSPEVAFDLTREQVDDKDLLKQRFRKGAMLLNNDFLGITTGESQQESDRAQKLCGRYKEFYDTLRDTPERKLKRERTAAEKAQLTRGLEARLKRDHFFKAIPEAFLPEEELQVIGQSKVLTTLVLKSIGKLSTELDKEMAENLGQAIKKLQLNSTEFIPMSDTSKRPLLVQAAGQVLNRLSLSPQSSAKPALGFARTLFAEYLGSDELAQAQDASLLRSCNQGRAVSLMHPVESLKGIYKLAKAKVTHDFREHLFILRLKK